MNWCHSCGAYGEPDSRFCTNCGTLFSPQAPRVDAQQKSSLLDSVLDSVENGVKAATGYVLAIVAILVVVYLIVRMIHYFWVTPLPM